jgi:hypothetical protein
MSPSAKFLSAAVVSLTVVGAIHPAAAVPAQTVPGEPTSSFLSTAPLYFEAYDARRFVARGANCTVSIGPREAVMLLTTSAAPGTAAFPGSRAGSLSGSETHAVRMTLLNAGTGTMSGQGELPGKVNYLIGRDASEWRSGVSLFSRVEIQQVYPNVDLVYYADHAARLEYDFIVHPGAVPEQIGFEIEGADSVNLNSDGELVIRLGGTEIRQHRPVLYQTVQGVRRSVAGGYRLTGRNQVGFRVGSYDRNRALVIDPVLTFATYLGGPRADNGWAIAVNPSNNDIYVAGETLSKNLAVTGGVLQSNYGGGFSTFGDAFVARYDGATKGLVYLTYLGGRANDAALGLEVDGTGSAYVTGFTDSRNFPIAPLGNALAEATLANSGRSNNAFRLFPVNVFVTKLAPSGSSLEFSTLVGGTRRESGNAIAVDASGVYVAGMTESANFPVIPAGEFLKYQPHFGGNGDAFLFKLDPSGTGLIYSTFLGGTNLDYAESIAIDDSGRAYITGSTTSTNFPVTNALVIASASVTNTMDQLNMQPKRTTRADAFVAKFTPLSGAGADLVYSSYLGGTNEDAGMAIAADNSGNAYVAGYTHSRFFPTNAVVLPASTGSNYQSHAFVTKIGDAGNVIYSVQFGSRGTDRATGIALNGSQVYVAGISTWTNFFATNSYADLRSTNAFLRRSLRSLNDVFITGIQETGGGVPLTFTNSVFLGGAGSELANDLVVRTVGADLVAWVGGQTFSVDWVTTNTVDPSLVQTNLGNVKKSRQGDAFVSEVLFPAP